MFTHFVNIVDDSLLLNEKRSTFDILTVEKRQELKKIKDLIFDNWKMDD